MTTAAKDRLTLFLCGDVMLGRGIDQILLHPGSPELYEPHASDARDYVRLAERVSGRIPRGVPMTYVWGDALAAFDEYRPDLRLINLETSVTSDGDPEFKGINYRMHPANVECLRVAGIDCCVLANNHVLDWGEQGLLDTVSTLRAAGMQIVGAGRDDAEALTPALLELPGGPRVRVHAFATACSGVPPHWSADRLRPGVCFLPDLSDASLERACASIERTSRAEARAPGAISVVSLHWGPNWGYTVSDEQRRFAHGLIDACGIDVVHGHSSHHAKGIEVYRHKPIVYGCGDFINDYEGITGHEQYRGDLSLMYFVGFDPVLRQLKSLHMLPLQLKRFRLQRASRADATWLTSVLNHEGASLGTRVARRADGTLELAW